MKHEYEIDYIAGKIVAPVDEFVIDLGHFHIIAGPNGYGKTMIMKLIQAVYELIGGRPPETLYQYVARVRSDYYDGSYVEYMRLFDRFTIKLKNGLTATIRPHDDTSGCFYTYTCGEETADIDLSKHKAVQTTQQITASSILLGQDRHYEYGRLIYDILSNGIVRIDQITEWYSKLFGNSTYQPYTGIPTWKPDEKRNAVIKRIDAWFERMSHGEQELFLHQIALQNYDLVLIDGVENGLHICVQEHYHEMIESYRPGIHNFIITTHSPSIPQAGYWNNVVELEEMNKINRSEIRVSLDITGNEPTLSP